jgi:hypothetical protein
MPFIEVVNIPQQRENILKLLDEPAGRIEAVVTSPKQSQNTSAIKLRGKVPPFYISIENHDVSLHNCLVDTGATNNIMPLEVMEALGMSCTRYYETGEIIYVIDSRKCQLMEKLNIYMPGLLLLLILLQFSILWWWIFLLHMELSSEEIGHP